MGEEMSITLPTEHGPVDCKALAAFDYKGRSYMAIAPKSNPSEINLIRYTEESNGISVENILDEDEYNAAANELVKYL